MTIFLFRWRGSFDRVFFLHGIQFKWNSEFYFFLGFFDWNLILLKVKIRHKKTNINYAALQKTQQALRFFFSVSQTISITVKWISCTSTTFACCPFANIQKTKMYTLLYVIVWQWLVLSLTYLCVRILKCSKWKRHFHSLSLSLPLFLSHMHAQVIFFFFSMYVALFLAKKEKKINIARWALVL